MGDERAQVETALGRRITDRQWANIEDRHRDWIGIGPTWVEDIVTEIREQEEIWTERPDPKDPAPALLGEDHPGSERAGPGLREKAISALAAADAQQNKIVKAFREDVLGGELLALADVEDWVKATAQDEGEPSVWLEVPVADNIELKRAGVASFYTEPPLSIDESSPRNFGWSIKFLSYPVAGSLWAGRIRVQSGGVLYGLRRLARTLADTYLWDEAGAVAFVLCGTTPLVHLVRSKPILNSRLPVLTRINLTVDPALSPSEVAEHYRELRSNLMGENKRFRMPSEKFLQLAIFYAECLDNDTWQTRMGRWNEKWSEQSKDWIYRDSERFGQDCRQAVRRLAKPSYFRRGR